MTDFTKKLKIALDIDQVDLSNVSKNLAKAVEAGFISEKSSKALTERIRESKVKDALLSKISEELQSLEGVKGKEARAYRRQLQRAQFSAELPDMLKDTFASKLKSVGTWFLDGIKSTFKTAWEELNTILSYSKLSSSTTRDLAFSYGFNASQSYGFSKAKTALGLQSEEDLMYMNEQERKQFLTAFNKYTEKYDKLYDQGFFEQLQDYQVEMNEFKEDMKLEVVQFFIENKNEIKTALKAMIELSKFTIKALSFLVRGTGSGNVMSASDIVNNYGSRSVNVKVDNTFNGVSKENATQITSNWKSPLSQLVAALPK